MLLDKHFGLCTSCIVLFQHGHMGQEGSIVEILCVLRTFFYTGLAFNADTGDL